MSIFRQPFEKHDYRGGLDSSLVYYLLRKYKPINNQRLPILLDQFRGGGIIEEVCKSLDIDYFYIDFPKESAQKTGYSSETMEIVLSHPPYWSAKKYTDNPEDLANKKTYKEFIEALCASLLEAVRLLKIGGYILFICGDFRKEKVLYPIHSDILQYMKVHDNLVLRDYVFWELSSTGTAMINTEWMIMGNFCLVYQKVEKKSANLNDL